MQISVFVPPLVWGGGEISSVRLLQWFHQKGYKVTLVMRTEINANLPKCIELVRLNTPTLKWRKKRYGFLPMSVLSTTVFLSRFRSSIVVALG